VEVSKDDSIILELCRLFFNSGATVIMYNYYTSVKSAWKLQDNSVFLPWSDKIIEEICTKKYFIYFI